MCKFLISMSFLAHVSIFPPSINLVWHQSFTFSENSQVSFWIWLKGEGLPNRVIPQVSTKEIQKKRECVWTLESLSDLKSGNDWLSYYDCICKMDDYKNTFANMCYMIVNQRSILMFSQQVMSNKVEKWVALSLKYFCHYSWRWQQISTCACNTREHSLYQ